MKELIFEKRRSGPENDFALDFVDKDGDDITLNSYANGGIIEIEVLSETGCMVLDREQAIQFAEKILQLTKEPTK